MVYNYSLAYVEHKNKYIPSMSYNNQIVCFSMILLQCLSVSEFPKFPAYQARHCMRLRDYKLRDGMFHILFISFHLPLFVEYNYTSC